MFLCMCSDMEYCLGRDWLGREVIGVCNTGYIEIKHWRRKENRYLSFIPSLYLLETPLL